MRTSDEAYYSALPGILRLAARPGMTIRDVTAGDDCV
jgi:hypothetical protein